MSSISELGDAGTKVDGVHLDWRFPRTIWLRPGGVVTGPVPEGWELRVLTDTPKGRV